MAEQLELGNIVELQKQSQQNVVAYHHGHPEVSPIKCDVRECVVRTSDSLRESDVLTADSLTARM